MRKASSTTPTTTITRFCLDSRGDLCESICKVSTPPQPQRKAHAQCTSRHADRHGCSCTRLVDLNPWRGHAAVSHSLSRYRYRSDRSRRLLWFWLAWLGSLSRLVSPRLQWRLRCASISGAFTDLCGPCLSDSEPLLGPACAGRASRILGSVLSQRPVGRCRVPVALKARGRPRQLDLVADRPWRPWAQIVL